MSNKKYTRDHEWLDFDDGAVTVGITQFAQEQLGDIVFVELPEPGVELHVGDEAAVIESVKAAGEVNAPLAGRVTAVNDALVEDPELVNRDPENQGWFFKLQADAAMDVDGLMDAQAYQEYLNQ